MFKPAFEPDQVGYEYLSSTRKFKGSILNPTRIVFASIKINNDSKQRPQRRYIRNWFSVKMCPIYTGTDNSAQSTGFIIDGATTHTRIEAGINLVTRKWQIAIIAPPLVDLLNDPYTDYRLIIKINVRSTVSIFGGFYLSFSITKGRDLFTFFRRKRVDGRTHPLEQ